MTIASGLRRLSQWLTLIILCLLPFLNANDWHEIKGNFFSIDFFGIPFADPVAYVQAVLAGANPLESISLAILCVLIIALALGRFFCGWFCPYGFFSEYLYKKNLAKKAKQYNDLELSKNISASQKDKLPALKWQIYFFIFACLVVYYLDYPLFSLFSFPGELSILPVFIWQGSFILLLEGAFLPFSMLVAEYFSQQRLWCRYFCPQGLILGLMAKAGDYVWQSLPFMRIHWQAKKCSCKGQNPCTLVCSMGLQPRHKLSPVASKCTVCLECLSTCSKHGKAISWKIN